MPIQIFCTISFSSSKEKHTIKCTSESNGNKSLYDWQEPEAPEESYEDGQELEVDEEESPPNLVAFANSCTLHGANHIFVEGGFGMRQALWAGAFLILLSIFLSQVAGRIFYYLEYHHITLLDEMESPQMVFPAVTFCNINRIRVSQLTYDDLSYISPLVGYDPGDYLEAGFPLASPSFEIPEEPINLYNFYDRNSHQLEDMMLNCKYRGQACEPDDFTVKSDFSVPIELISKKDCKGMHLSSLSFFEPLPVQETLKELGSAAMLHRCQAYLSPISGPEAKEENTDDPVLAV